jgi:hypothetical protein
MMHRRLACFSLAISAALLLSGCTAATAIPEFEREQTGRDRPSALRDAEGDVRPDSIRFVGTLEETDIYLGRWSDSDNGLCLLFVPASESVSAACSDSDGVGAELPNGTRVEAGSYFSHTNEDSDRLSESVRFVAAD